MDDNTLTDLAVGFAAPFLDWLEKLDREPALMAIAVVALVVLFRKSLATRLAQVVRWVLGTLSITLGEEVDSEIETFLRVLLVTGSLLLAQEVVALPEFAGGVARRLLISILVLAIFAAWYRLVEPMVALINPRKIGVAAIDTSWIVRLGQFVVVLMSITALLAVWEIDISSALTGVGVLGAGLAIASQDFIRNLVAGMNNMSEKRFETGDWIAVAGIVEGTVTRVDVRSTTVMGFDHVPHYVPNSELSNAIVLNKSRMDHRRIYWTIGLVLDATDAQVEQVCNAIRAHMQESDDFVHDGSCPLIVCPKGLSENAIEILALGFTQTKEYQPFIEAGGRLVAAIRHAVNGAGTELAYPTHTIKTADSLDPQVMNREPHRSV
ncbi:mechanosensitive ion channel family protein [Tropicimonas marinistellae]|uniref:mechanosensitive ion channel family protein n=1 Tax=Tropicimonas marinistellae TaxID=1739787 RepID=UPI00082CB38D|nr:mechanosensitive ion channel family protein [Tropicimonas marinistellae]